MHVSRNNGLDREELRKRGDAMPVSYGDNERSKYLRRGVSAHKQGVHHAIASLNKGLFPGAFCKILPDHLGREKAYANVMHADGAGTKASLAYIYWRETGDLSIFADLVQDALVMNIDDLLCVGATETAMVFSSCIGRNKRYIPGEVVKALIEGTEAFLERMRSLGFDMWLAGGETADMGDTVRTLVVDSTVTTRMKKSDVIDNKHIRAGDVVVGLASDGQAEYETVYNSGIGSNGLTSLRHDLFHADYAQKYPESYDPKLSQELAYTGKYHLDDIVNVDGKNIPLGKLALSPTRTYAPVLREVLQKYRKQIHGLVHCSGSGQDKVLSYLKMPNKPLRVIKNNLFPVPPLFALLPSYPSKSLYNIFNMGHRLELYVDGRIAEDIIKIAKSYHVKAQQVGHVEAVKSAAEVEVQIELPKVHTQPPKVQTRVPKVQTQPSKVRIRMSKVQTHQPPRGQTQAAEAQTRPL